MTNQPPLPPGAPDPFISFALAICVGLALITLLVVAFG